MSSEFRTNCGQGIFRNLSIPAPINSDKEMTPSFDPPLTMYAARGRLMEIPRLMRKTKMIKCQF